jgi:hypothetical protein
VPSVAEFMDLNRQNLKVSTFFLSPKQLMYRWACSRSSVDRIAARAGITRVCLGEGENGMVRFPLAEIEAYEKSRSIKPGDPLPTLSP